MSDRLSNTRFLEGRALKLLLAALFAITVATGTLTSPAQAKLQGAGPVNPSNGFPYWYQDEGGTRLDLCLDPQDQMCLQPFEMPNPDGPVSFPDNFPGEAFWWVGDASMTMSNGADATLVMAQEAAFVTEDPIDGDQASFGRIRVRLDGLEPGQTYRVTHPYGVDEVVAEADGSVFATEDVGCLLPTPQSPCKFGASDESLSSRIGPFLRWDEGAPEGYVGDPNVPHAVTGSPNDTNYFKVEKLADDGSVAEVMGETDQFTVSGKLATPQVDAAPRREIFNSAEDVTLVPSDPSYEVYYTEDGSDPSDPANASRKAYTGPIGIDADAGQTKSTTLRFVAVDPATDEQSKVMEKTYTVDRQAPSLGADPAAGTYETAQDVTLSTGSASDKIFYTTDGSDPKVEVTNDPTTGQSIDVLNGTEYAAPIKVARSQTIKAIAVDEAGNKSQVEAYRYTIASLVAKGPHNPATGTDPNGFPFWYKDANGVKLELCLDPNDQMCLQPFEMPDATQPVSFPENFPGEAFWWAGDASMTLDNGADAILVMAQEAAFTNENPKDGDQDSFGRVRIRVDGLQVGQKYRVSHPYGTKVYTATDNGLGSGEINVTDDIGCFGTAAAPCDFDATRFSGVGPFLTWDTYGTDSPDAPPAGYVGDPNIEGGHKVKGSPVTDAAGNPQNYFQIERQNADGSYSQIGRTDDFIISGKVARMQVEAGKAGGSYKAPQDVLLRASEPDAKIYYTTDGSEPTTASPSFVGEGTVSQVADATLKFMAVGADGSQSQVHTETYVTDTVAPTVTADPNSGTFDGPRDVTLSTGDAKDRIYFTKGALGSQVPNPTEQSTLYSAPIRVAAPTTIKAIAVDRAGNASAPKTFDYDVVIPPAAPSSPVQNLKDFDQIGVKAPLATSTLPVTLNWNASPSNGVTSYQVQQSVNGGQFADVPAASQPGAATNAKLNLAMGTINAPNKYQFRVRACAGPACSSWASGPNFTLLPVDEGTVNSGLLARIGFNGKWTTENVAGSYGGTVRHSSTARDKAQLNKIEFTVNGNFAWISTLGPNRGLASVSVDGGPARTVDLYSPTLQPARVAFAANNLAAGTEHTVTVQVLGTRNPASAGTRVDIDGFVAIF